eukprot:TRINITY_DN9182_c0_g1_i15.p1 TRINITY_DN9182_c0_g1~~TRINITY_DN9182_c0_g1_i15.p1  ORF type:complete len:107 (-),score=3.57 TRINITY_DN9182_c0_g1_i15:91-411(-)
MHSKKIHMTIVHTNYRLFSFWFILQMKMYIVHCRKTLYTQNTPGYHCTNYSQALQSFSISNDKKSLCIAASLESYTLSGSSPSLDNLTSIRCMPPSSPLNAHMFTN